MTRPRKVLVIDDDPIALETVRERLTRHGHHVVTRDQALGTTLAVRAQRPDVVLLDVMMPVLNGDHLAGLLGADNDGHEVAIILHSSKSEAELAALVKQTRARGAIRKTSDDARFMKELYALLDG